MTLQSLKGGAIILVAVGLLAAGCGGDDSASPTTSSSTTVAATSTTSESTSSVPSSSSSPTSIATTTGEPTTTTLPVEEQVAADYRATYEAYWVCLREPVACDPASLAASQGPARAKLTEAVKALIDGQLHVGPDDYGYMVIEGVSVDPNQQTATVKACWWDTGVVYGPPAQSGGSEVVVNNLQVTSRFDSTMFLEGGSWRLGEERRLERTEGKNTCPPEQ